MNPQSPAPLLALSSELPELPQEELIDDKDWAVYGYTADQMRAYATEAAAYWKEMHRSLLTAYNELLAAKGWLPIESAPVGREMFVVRAFNVSNGFTGGKPYTTDPWCVWHDNYGEFQRWPHNFPPTHWQPLPPTPGSEVQP